MALVISLPVALDFGGSLSPNRVDFGIPSLAHKTSELTLNFNRTNILSLIGKSLFKYDFKTEIIHFSEHLFLFVFLNGNSIICIIVLNQGFLFRVVIRLLMI